MVSMDRWQEVKTLRSQGNSSGNWRRSSVPRLPGTAASWVRMRDNGRDSRSLQAGHVSLDRAAPAPGHRFTVRWVPCWVSECGGCGASARAPGSGCRSPRKAQDAAPCPYRVLMDPRVTVGRHRRRRLQFHCSVQKGQSFAA